MKIINITIIYLALLLLCYSHVSKAEITTPPECSPFEYSYTAIISTLDFTQVGITNICEDGSGGVINDPFLYYKKASFQNPVDSVYFKTTVDVSLLNIPNQSIPAFIHFADISKSSTTGLPSIQEMIIGATIAYDRNGYSLIVNYQSLLGENSTTIQLDSAHPRFDVTLSWINAGCITECNSNLGQIEVKVNYENQEIVQLIDGLFYETFANSGENIDWQAKTVFFGKLVVENMTGNLILDTPMTP